MNLASLLLNKPFVPPPGTPRLISHMPPPKSRGDKSGKPYTSPGPCVKDKSIRGRIMNIVAREKEAMFEAILKETGFTEKSARQTICDLKSKGLLASYRIQGVRQFKFYLTERGEAWLDEFNAM